MEGSGRYKNLLKDSVPPAKSGPWLSSFLVITILKIVWGTTRLTEQPSEALNFLLVPLLTFLEILFWATLFLTAE